MGPCGLKIKNNLFLLITNCLNSSYYFIDSWSAKNYMAKRIWFTEGFSSQREIILAIKDFSKKYNVSIEIFASHREYRKEILSVADYAFIEPSNEQERLPFLINTIEKYCIDVLYIAKNASWYEKYRSKIELTGVKLITGASDIQLLNISENKMDFALFMQKQKLSVVPSILINNINELKKHFANPPFENLCIKPVEGIYGMGFWRFDNKISPSRIFSHPEDRKVKPEVYLQLCEASNNFKPMVLMPYLGAPECSVDIIADKGDILSAIAREKHGSKQILKNSGSAFELACQCAEIMQADGLVNVQTRNNELGLSTLLEINMRPSGGVGNTLLSGINLPGLMVMFHLNVMTQAEIKAYCLANFKSTEVISLPSATKYPEKLTNLI